jgi:hypothetical protein
MNNLRTYLKTTRVSIWLLLCILVLTATSVYAAGNQLPLAAVDILGSPDAAVNGKFAVGTTTPGNKALTVAGVIDFVGAGTVHNYFTQGPGNNMQIRSNVDEYNSVGNSSYAQWNMVMGASLDVFSIRRSPASATYNEDALFWIEGSTGNIGIAKVDTSNGATIPFTLNAKLHVETTSGDAIKGVSTATSGMMVSGVYGQSDSTSGLGVYGVATATSGGTYGVYGRSDSPGGGGVVGYATATYGSNKGVYGYTNSSQGIGVFGEAAGSGMSIGVVGQSWGTAGVGVYGYGCLTSGTPIGVEGVSEASTGYDFYAGGNGADYGPFTGVHEAKLIESFYGEVKSGLIVSVTGEAEFRRNEDGNVDISSTLPTVKLADTPEDNAVFGVLVGEVILPEDHWYISDDSERFASVNALGEGRVWVISLNGDIQAGDYITTSAIPGYGQVQEDHILHGYTLAKATETADWGSVTETVTFNGKEYKVYLLAVVYTSG